MVLPSPTDQKYPRDPLVLKFNVTLARSLRSVIFKWKLLQVIGACIFMTANELKI